MLERKGKANYANYRPFDLCILEHKAPRSTCQQIESCHVMSMITALNCNDGFLIMMINETIFFEGERLLICPGACWCCAVFRATFAPDHVPCAPNSNAPNEAGQVKAAKDRTAYKERISKAFFLCIHHHRQR